MGKSARCDETVSKPPQGPVASLSSSNPRVEGYSRLKWARATGASASAKSDLQSILSSELWLIDVGSAGNNLKVL